MEQIQNLHPSSFTLEDMDKELVCMTLIRALLKEYSSFASSLQLLDKFEKKKLQEVFVAEELLRNRSQNLNDPLSSSPSSSAASALAASHITSSNVTCSFCLLSGHAQASCHRYKAAQSQAS